MSKCKAETTYLCDFDCLMQGCPTHKAELIFDSITNSYFFKLGKQELFLDHAQVQALINLLKKLDYRVEIKSILIPIV